VFFLFSLLDELSNYFLTITTETGEAAVLKKQLMRIIFLKRERETDRPTDALRRRDGVNGGWVDFSFS